MMLEKVGSSFFLLSELEPMKHQRNTYLLTRNSFVFQHSQTRRCSSSLQRFDKERYDRGESPACVDIDECSDEATNDCQQVSHIHFDVIIKIC